MKIDIEKFEKYLYSRSKDSITADFWDKRAKGFSESYKKGKSSKDEFIFNKLDKLEILEKTDSVIDIGCGNGIHSKDFVKRLSFYKGSDISPKMIEIAKKNKSNNITFNVESLEEVNGVFDIVFSSMCPAINSIDNLKKFNSLGKRYAIMHKILSEKDSLSDLIGENYLNKAHNNSPYVYGLINILWGMGYFPEMVVGFEETKKQVPIDDFKNKHSLTPNEERKIKSLIKADILEVSYRRKRALIYWKL